MTEKECLKALDCLYDEDVFDKEVWGFVMEGDNLSCADVERAKKYYRDKIYNLIKEHFYNPPLKFEEIEDLDILWHNKREEYIKVTSKFINKIGKETICFVYFGSDYEDYDYFEEGMFYKKEVKDE